MGGDPVGADQLRSGARGLADHLEVVREARNAGQQAIEELLAMSRQWFEIRSVEVGLRRPVMSYPHGRSARASGACKNPVMWIKDGDTYVAVASNGGATPLHQLA